MEIGNVLPKSPSAGIHRRTPGGGAMTEGAAGGAAAALVVLLHDEFNIADGNADQTLWGDGASVFHNRLLINYAIGAGRTINKYPPDATYEFDLGSVLVPNGSYVQPNVLQVRNDGDHNVKIGFDFTVAGGVVTAARLYGQSQDGTDLFTANIVAYSDELSATEFWFRKVRIRFHGMTLAVSVNGTAVASVSNASLTRQNPPELVYLGSGSLQWHITFDNFTIYG